MGARNVIGYWETVQYPSRNVSIRGLLIILAVGTALAHRPDKYSVVYCIASAAVEVRESPDATPSGSGKRELLGNY